MKKQENEEMALHVCDQFNSDWGLAITGYASPVPESGHKLFAFYAISFQGNITDQGKIIPPDNNSLGTQLYYANEVLRRWLSGL
ncbi:MAG: hypothetical protein ACTHMV_09220 [Chitinophagaceae bacterium]